MKKQFKVGVIGCGDTARAILRGIVLSDFIHERKIIVNDESDENIEKLSDLGVRDINDNKFIVESSEYLLLGIKANEFESTVASFGGAKPQKIISVVDGLKKNTIKNAFGISAVKVAKCVPNLPCSIGSGITGIDMTDFNSSVDDIAFISSVFNCVGTVLSVDESKIDAVAALSGNGPAYTLMFIDSLIDAGVEQGLSKSEAKSLAVQTVLGTAELLAEQDKTISSLLMQTCNSTKASTEAVKVLEDNGLRSIISQAVAACAQKIEGVSDK